MAGFSVPMGGDGGGISEAPPSDFLAELDAVLDTSGDPAPDDPGPVDDPVADAAPIEDDAAPVEDPAGDEPPVEEEPAEGAEETTPVAEEPTDASAAKGVTDPNLPEGVHAYERHGKQFMSVPKEVWDRTFTGFQGVQALEEVIGEPLTREAIAARQESHLIRTMMRDDYVSADPEQQANFIAQFLGYEANQAVANGEVEVNPLLTFAAQLPQVLQAQYPEAFQQLESTTLRASLDALYLEASRLGLDNKDAQHLLYSVQRIDKLKFGDYRRTDKVKEMASKSPGATAPDEVAVLRQQLQQRDAQERQATYKNWSDGTNRQIGSSIDGTISEKLNSPSVAKAYKPEDLAAVRTELHTAVSESLKAHAQWNNDMKLYLRQAQRAATPERRDAIRQAMATQANNIARRVVEAKLPSILAKHTKRVVAANQQLHHRRAAGAQNRGAGTPGAPGTRVTSDVRQTRAAFNSDAEFASELDRVLGA